jgi:autotransporter-associated beta strand protein
MLFDRQKRLLALVDALGSESCSAGGKGNETMKTRTTNRLALLCTMGLAFGFGVAVDAGTYQWDTNLVTAGAQLGAGNWDTSTANWYNGVANSTWNNGANDTAQFNGSGGPNNYTVTITEPITIGGLQTTSTGYGSATIAASGAGALNLGLAATPITNAYIAGNGLTISAPMTGLGAVFGGPSSVILSGSNSFTGSAVVNSNLTVSHLWALGDTSVGTIVNSGGGVYLNNTLPAGTFPEPLIMNGGLLSDGSANALSAGGLITVQADSTIETPNIGGRALTLKGGITNTGVNLTLRALGSGDTLTVNTGAITGTGTITTVFGNIRFGGTNTFSGVIAVTGGLLWVDNSNAIQYATMRIDTNATLAANVATPISSSLVLNGGTLYDNFSGDMTWSGPISLTKNSKIELWGSGRKFTLGSGATVSLGTSTLTLKGGVNGVDNGYIIDAKITGDGGITLTNNSASLTLGNGGSDYTGPTVVDGTANRILLSAENAMSSNSDVIVNRMTAVGNGGLNLYNHSAIIGSLGGTGSVYVGNNGGVRTLTTGANNHTSTFSGVLDGPGNLTKIGTGTLFLNGSNILTGTTTVMDGRIGGNGWLSGKLLMSNTGGFAAQADSVLKVKGNVDLSTQNDSIALVGPKPTGRTPIITYTGTLTGKFGTEVGVKVDYSVLGEIAILPIIPGTVISVR